MNEQGPATPETTSRAGLRPLWLGLGALITMLWFPPISIVLGIAAVVVAVRARRAARGEKTPGLIAGVVMGLIATAMSALSLLGTALLYDELQGLTKCQAVVNTETDKQHCRDEWLPKIEDKLNLPKGSFEKYGYDKFF
ncbi:hypothetical protein GCM10022221_53970 [Actinocorallia aurea]